MNAKSVPVWTTNDCNRLKETQVSMVCTVKDVCFSGFKGGLLIFLEGQTQLHQWFDVEVYDGCKNSGHYAAPFLTVLR